MLYVSMQLRPDCHVIAVRCAEWIRSGDALVCAYVGPVCECEFNHRTQVFT